MNVLSCSGRDIHLSYNHLLINLFANDSGAAHAETMAPTPAPTGAPGHRYTHGHHESVLRSHRWRTAQNSAAYLLPSLRPGQDILDVGCGPGTITVDLARHIGT